MVDVNRKTKLLGSNYKLAKSKRFLVSGCSMSPHNIGGHGNACEGATESCMASCVLRFVGRTVMGSVRDAMAWRKSLLNLEPIVFFDRLHKEFESCERNAEREDLLPIYRMNVGTDYDWSDLARANPNRRFYDYTKVVSRLWDESWPANYQLTYSRSEKTPDELVKRITDSGRNVAVVFSTRYSPANGICDDMPESWNGIPVVDGDSHDVRIRELDGCGVIVGLRFKGSLAKRAKAIESGFCVKVSE